MKSLLLIVFSIVLCTALRAQGDAPDCGFCVTVCDRICSQGDCGQPDANWTVKTFQVPCDTLYQVTASTSCASGNCACSYFRTCVLVFEGTNPAPIASPHTLNCASSLCTDVFPNVRMRPNVTYTIKVAKLPCDSGEPCSTCSPDGCSSLGRVYRHSGDICGTWICN